MGKEVKRSFVFNIDWRDVLMDYPPEVRYEVYDAIIEYAASGKLLELKPLAKMAFSFIRKEMDYNNKRYLETVSKRREAGKKGMATRYGNNKDSEDLTNVTNDNKTNTCYQDLTKLTNATDNVNDNVNDIIPPSNPPDGGGAEGEGSSGKRQELEAKESALMAKEQELLKREAALKSSQRNALPPVDFVSPEFVHVFTVWLEYKRERKESYKSEKSLKAAYSKLLQLSGNDPAKASAIVEQSMANNWAGLFELKERKHAANTGVILTDNSATKYDQDDERWKR